jgi:membrane-associated phospholipid phosphatase
MRGMSSRAKHSDVRGAAIVFLASALLTSVQASADCFWSHIDHKVTLDESGPWNPSTYRTLLAGAMVADLGAALWEGSDSRIGRTAWQAVDSVLLATVTTGVSKHIFSRDRPTDGTPCDWFESGSHHSFPSNEAAMSAAVVAPYIFEYGQEEPAVYGLALLPLYIGTARIKNQRHWQSDVVAGWMIGALAGRYAHKRDTPITVILLPDAITIGISSRF